MGDLMRLQSELEYLLDPVEHFVDMNTESLLNERVQVCIGKARGLQVALQMMINAQSAIG
jgi:hypothetical protein